LFEVAAPVDQGALSAKERALEIEQRLENIAQQFIGSDAAEEIQVTSQIDEESNQPVIYVNGEQLMTVTYLDARLNGANSLTLRATQIAAEVERALRRFSDEREPNYLWSQVRWAVATLFLTLLGHFAIAHFYHGLDQRRRLLKQSQQSPDTGANDDPLPPANFTNSIRITLLTRQKLNSLAVLKQFLRLLQIILWVASGVLILGFFPYTRWLQPLIVGMMRLPLRFLLIGLVTYGLIRFSGIWIDRLFVAFQSRTAATIERSQRLVLRLSTFSQVIKGIVAFVIGSIAFLIMLSLLGVRVAPLLAGAGLLGFAVSFASQSLIKDIINGFLVLLEDQYGVGDVITVKGMSGFVENMNLRITQLRATDGQLITIPNGQIDIVQNLSKEWSRVDLMVPVGLAADIDEALRLVETVANEMRKDEIWGSLILEPPLLLGVDELTHAGATIRIWIKTQPMKQWDVAREYRRRLKIAFENSHIPVGVPQQMIYISGPPEQAGMITAPPESANGSAWERSPTPPPSASASSR
jgi:small conductance mechanosensitive channel